MEIQVTVAGHLSWLDDFYLRCGYGGRVEPEDKVYFASIHNLPVGVVRLAKERGVFVLRGMQVLDSWRGRGIGCELLSCLSTELVDDCYCLPYQHLDRFYGAVVFVDIDVVDLPTFLAERLKAYRQRGMQVMAMRKKAASHLL